MKKIKQTMTEISVDVLEYYETWKREGKFLLS